MDKTAICHRGAIISVTSSRCYWDKGYWYCHHFYVQYVCHEIKEVGLRFLSSLCIFSVKLRSDIVRSVLKMKFLHCSVTNLLLHVILTRDLGKFLFISLFFHFLYLYPWETSHAKFKNSVTFISWDKRKVPNSTDSSVNYGFWTMIFQ